MNSFIDMANRLIQFSPKKETEIYRNTTTLSKNVPGRRQVTDAIVRGMGRKHTRMPDDLYNYLKSR